MNVMALPRFVTAATLALGALSSPSLAQQPTAEPAVVVARLVAEPTSLTIEAGHTVPLKVTAYDAQGKALPDARVRLSGPRRSLMIIDGQVKGLAAGSFEIVASAAGSAPDQPVTISVRVTVSWPAVGRVELSADPGRLYTGVTLVHRARALHADGSERPSDAVSWRWSSSSDAVATVDRFGYVTAHRPGAVTITASTTGARADLRHTVVANPVTAVAIQLDQTTVKTGDVVHLEATAERRGGQAVPDVPITWSYTYV
ncbi:MAG TPA: Ig-like domain-containing protein, partial [Gemmatimonadales bacterium]